MRNNWNESIEGVNAFGLGDLTEGEIKQIQDVVDEAGRPLNVVGSAACGGRGEKNEIDYVVGPSSIDFFKDLVPQLPLIDPNDGIIPGIHNPYQGPSIRFEPGKSPKYIPGR